MSSKETPMTAVDRSWLRMETVQNPMMISAVLVFEQPIHLPRLKRVLTDRFLRYRRFRQRIHRRGDREYWQDDPLFDIDNHIHVIALPGEGGQKELQDLVSDLNSTALDFRRPLWQIHYVDQYDGGCALVVRIHHCIADGISLVRVLLSLTDPGPEATASVHKLTTSRSRVRTAGLIGRLTRRARNTAETARQQSRLFLQSLREESDYPLKLLNSAGKITMDLVKLGLSPFEPSTRLKGDLCGRKQAAWAPPLELDEVKQCARALNGTVNDVLLCAAAGAFHKHFLANGDEIPECGIRVAVPFNLRPLDQPVGSLGNQFGLVLVNLPVEANDPIGRFRKTQDNMNRLKRSYQAQVTYSLLDLFGRGPDVLERRALDILSSKASAVLTNVPGPRDAVYLAGSRLKQPMFWVPQSGNIGIGMSIFSYAGTVQFGITVDRNIKADPQQIMNHFRESYEELRDRALNQPNTGAYLTAVS
jgi:diacylglycerol O-acyltransferase